MATSNARSRRSYQRREPELYTNLLPVQLSSTTVQGYELPYESPEGLNALRDEYRDSYVVQRVGNKMVLVPFISDAPNCTGTEVELVAREHHGVFRRLISEAMIRKVDEWGFALWSFNPPVFVMRSSERDLMVQTGCDGLDWLHVYPRYTLHPKIVFGRSGPEFGVLVDLRTSWEIAPTIYELLAKPLSVIGRYALTNDPARQAGSLRDPLSTRRLAGRIESATAREVKLSEPRDTATVSPNLSWLEPRRETISEIIRGTCGPAEVAKLEDAVAALVVADSRLKRTRDIAGWLSRQALPIAEGLSGRIQEPKRLQGGLDAGRYHRMSAPTFVFDQAGNKTGWNPDRGLEEFGPFDAEVFTPKRPTVAVVTPREYQGDVEVFLRKFKEGVPNAPTFAQGFVRKYRLSDCTFAVHPFDVGSDAPISYRAACLRALQGEARPDLAIVVIKEEYKSLHGDDDPYLVSKSIFMAQGVAVQEIEIETIRVPRDQERGVPYTLSGIALAAYAKLGGVPFVIAASRSLSHELVIGIGHAQVGGSRLGARERIVGITTVFSADGNYLLHNTSREVGYEAYPDALLDSLRDTIQRIKARNAWQTGDTIRLIFHVFKPLKDIEVEAVKDVVGSLVSDFSVEFAFLHVSDDHDWMLFDSGSEGIPDWQVRDSRLRGRTKGRFVPDRGYSVLLGRSAALLTVIGPKGLVTPLQGCPRPLQITLHRESTFVDLDYLVGQLYRFTSLSWRSLFPTSQPVTILYSELIASLLGRLRHVKNWNSDMITTSLRTSRWFL